MPTIRIPFLGAILLGTLAVMAACGSLSEPMKPAPDFQFNVYRGADSLGGTQLSLSNLEGKPVVLNFWAGLCPPCLAEMPDFQRFHDGYGDRVHVFGLDVGPFTSLGSEQNALDLLSDLDITYPTGNTSEGQVILDYEVFRMPSTFFITADGKIYREWEGGLLNVETLFEVTNEMMERSGTSLGEPRETS